MNKNSESLRDELREEELCAEHIEMIFDCFNSDFKLLMLRILLEGYDNSINGLQIFTLGQFIKDDYWKINEIREEIQDTNDFNSIANMIFEKVTVIIEEIEIAEIKRIGIDDISELPKFLIKEIIANDNLTDNDIEYYALIIDEICDLKNKYNKKAGDEIEKDDDINQKLDGINFNTCCEASRNIGFAYSLAPSQIEIEVIFNSEIVKEIIESLDDYLSNFSKDNCVDNKPTYQEKRFYFSKQLENFYRYISNFPVINGYINIPFSSLQETGFEIVKILSYLEKEGKIKVRNWNDEDIWNIKLHTTPLSLESIISSEPNSDQIEDKENSAIKYDQGVLYFKGKEIDFRNKQNQKDLLETLFKEKDKNWFYDEIEEDWDETGIDMEKNPKDYWRKFYSAGDDINTAVAKKTQIEDFIIKNTKEIRINPKYL